MQRPGPIIPECFFCRIVRVVEWLIMVPVVATKKVSCYADHSAVFTGQSAQASCLVYSHPAVNQTLIRSLVRTAGYECVICRWEILSHEKIFKAVRSFYWCDRFVAFNCFFGLFYRRVYYLHRRKIQYI